MKFGRLSSLLLVAVLAVSIYSCKDKDENPKPTPEPGAGKGGDITFRITPVHDGVDIDSCKVYVKYGTEFQPEATNLYDDSLVCTQLNGRPVATFAGLRKGTYFFYAKGWDLIRSQVVEGTRVLKAEKEGAVNELELQTYAID